MKRLFFLLYLMTPCLIFAIQDPVSIPNKDTFDSYWKLVDENTHESELFKEWIPVSENKDSWTKSFGVQYYQLPEDYDIHYFYKMFIETLANDFKENQQLFQHEVLKEDSNHILFSWWCNSSDYEIGREWIHVLKDNDHHILFVRFATKDCQIQEKDKPWIECLEKADFLSPIKQNVSLD